MKKLKKVWLSFALTAIFLMLGELSLTVDTSGKVSMDLSVNVAHADQNRRVSRRTARRTSQRNS